MRPSDMKAAVDSIQQSAEPEKSKKVAIVTMAVLGLVPTLIGLFILVKVIIAVGPG